jgi:uncharacterized protein YbaR (Trm112 family)
MIDKRLLDVLACPKCNGEVHEKGMFILCKKCGIAFPVLEDSVPDMIIDESWPLQKAEKGGFRHELHL